MPYFKKEGLDIPQLINDDFLKAVKLCYNNELYVSALKLILSFIDSISFVVSGESSAKSFKNWLDNYCKIEEMGITSSELWEHRNAILHITSLDSFRVKEGKEKRLIAYIGSEIPKTVLDQSDSHTKYFEIMVLMKTLEKGIEQILIRLNERTIDFEQFLERYDLIVSDSRNLKIKYTK